VVSIVTLIVLLSAIIGVVTEVFSGRYLVNQLDMRLGVFQARVQDTSLGVAPASGLRPPRLPSCDSSEFGFRQQDGISICLTGTVVTRAIVGSHSVVTRLTEQQLAAVRSADLGMDAVTVTIPGLGDYRVLQRIPPAASSTSEAVVQITGYSLSDVENTQRRLAEVMALVAGGAIIFGGLTVFFIVRRSLRPLDRVAATARKVATLPLDRGEVELAIRVPLKDTDSRTEIGSVGAAINQMLGHVSGALTARHASETRVRQFVADASHELRTPLAAIRGYAELARRSEHEPGAVAHALRRVESESARMTTLVDDLLLLARLDSGRPLSTEEVDLTMLVVDRVSDARVAGTEHKWQLDLPDEPVVAMGDGARLHQVVANLLANARNHTPPGTVVVTTLRCENSGVVLTVEDDGPGIPAELQPEIFGRFVRGDSSRSRAAGSTGLGLAIVAAVISAHGGTVAIESRPGRTCARVWLPDHVQTNTVILKPLPASSGAPGVPKA